MSNKKRGERVEVNPVDESLDGTDVSPEITQDVVEDVEPEMPAIQNGVVSLDKKFSKLNVRKHADVNSDVVWSITNGTEVEIDMSKSTDKFYKVSLTNGTEGYCVKDFIEIK